MAKDRLRRRIAEALAGPSVRDDLQRILRDDALRPDRHGAPVALPTILDSVRDPIITVDRDGIVLGANAAAARVLAATMDAIEGRALGDFMPQLAPAGPALEALADRVGDTFVDVTPTLIEARRDDGYMLSVEVSVSRAGRSPDGYFVLSMRDVTERLQDEQALRESEARYRALVENAPEAIVVLDVDRNRFVDVNDNAVRLFGLPRARLLAVDPGTLSPEFQSDGLLSAGLNRGYIERALKGGRPVFEWLHRDAAGQEVPCEVRFIRLPSSKHRLIRASIIDIAARRRADTLAFGERRVLELIAANAPLERTLQAVVRLVEQLHPNVGAAVQLLDERGAELRLAAATGLPKPVVDLLAALPVGLRSGACGAAASLGRQVVVRDVQADSLCAGIATDLVAAGVRACCSTPVVTAGDRIHGTLAIYFDAARGPTTDEIDLITRLTQLAGIAIRRKQDETALRDSEARFRALFDNVVDGVYQAKPDGELLSVNPALVQMLGYDDAHELGRSNMAELFVDPKERERLVLELTTYGRVRNFEYRLRTRSGRAIVVIENSRLVLGADGRALYFEGTVTDVTQRKAAERALFNEKERAQVTLQSIGDAVVTTDAQGHVDYLNPVAEQLTGWDSREARGMPIESLIKLTDEITGEAVQNPVLRCLQEGRVVALAGNVVLAARDGTAVAIQDSAAPIQDRSGQIVGAVMVFHDVSQERQLHRKLAYFASHDALTGFLNRREFEERLAAALAAVQNEPGRSGALLYMDLDQFKVVNDTCGHGAGDLLLRQLADVLRQRVPKSGALARLGGDEFAVLLPDCTMAVAGQIAEGLREAIAAFRFAWRDNSLQVGVSIGIVPVQASSESVGALMSAADVACYVAKDLGRNRIHVYEEGDAAERHQEMQWVARINRALEEERFELFYQPIVPTVARADTWPHYELLLRMRDERGELVAPTAFIPAAERYNLMPSLDRWVISQTLETLVYRGEPGTSPYTLAINLSGTTLNDARFLDFVLDELTAAAVPPGAVCFEITETAAIANLSQVVTFMRALKARGCRFSLDDFGTGLSSLTYLKNLPVDYVKIDGQFVRNVLRDAADECVVESIARMARAFKIEAIAERVESRDVMKRLGELGVAYAQGFFVAVPQPVSELPIRSNVTRIRA
ncbi:MAG TPA: EAL domain-containing protein [Gammaproteobacteria bacterium]|nr:EAL domain-containing protein [Gammaproteobacteria bacterium]